MHGATSDPEVLMGGVDRVGHQMRYINMVALVRRRTGLAPVVDLVVA